MTNPRFQWEQSDVAMLPDEPVGVVPIVEFGGPGSGHHGHKGIKGHKGGSAKSQTGEPMVNVNVIEDYQPKKGGIVIHEEFPPDIEEARMRFNQARRGVGRESTDTWAEHEPTLWPPHIGEDVPVWDAEPGERETLFVLQEYKNSLDYARAFNKTVRDGSYEQDHTWSTAARLFDAAMSKTAAPEDFIAVRGLHGNIAGRMEGLNIGDVFMDKGYASTTLNTEDINESGFIGSYNAMEILIPKGAHGIYMDGPHLNAGYDNEDEYLLARNSKFLVLDKQQTPMPGHAHDTRWIYKVALIGQGQ